MNETKNAPVADTVEAEAPKVASLESPEPTAQAPADNVQQPAATASAPRVLKTATEEKCPKCGAIGRVNGTRRYPEFIERRYKCPICGNPYKATAQK